MAGLAIPLPVVSGAEMPPSEAELDLEAMPFAPAGVSPLEAAWRKWVLWCLGPVAGVVLISGAWSLVSSRNVPPAVPSHAAVAPAPFSADKPAASKPAATASQPRVRLDRRWLPDDSRMVVALRPSALTTGEALSPVLSLVESNWRPAFGPILEGLGLKPEMIGQFTWASTDLGDWPNSGVLAITLVERQDARRIQSLGQAIDLQLAGATCRRLVGGWRHPFAVFEDGTIVTGREDLLRPLAARGEGKLKCGAIDRFLAGMAVESQAIAVVDLAAARQADWPLPTALMDVWPKGKSGWRRIWETPQAIGLTLRQAERATSEVALVCEGETSADQVQAALAELVAAAKSAVADRVEELGEDLQSGRITADAAARYEALLKRGEAALQAAHWQVAEDTVWVRIDWGAGIAALAQAALEGRQAAQADWLRAALEADTVKAKQLLSGLGSYQRAEATYPPGAAGGSLLPPETRLSWIARLLPYCDHLDWHRELQFGYSWNSPQNRPVTRRPLEPVTNPALGPGTTEAGFPVTHYVGVAGVGADAADLEADDPRAGVFGYNRAIRPQDIPDGASNTIALLGVTGQLGAWGAGGRSTVRGLTKQPYVNGPDGFGSGQPDGMVVGMADGSVRFVSKDVDPAVLEQLATAGGKEPVTVAAIEPRPIALPKPAKPEPELAADKPLAVKPPPAALLPEAAKPEPAPKPPSVNVEARLAEKIPGFTLPGVPFREAMDLVSQISSVPITLDLDVMAQLGVTLDDPVTVRLTQTTLGAALEKIAASRGLVYAVQDGQILITRPAEHRARLQTVRHSVADLTGRDPAATKELAAMIQRLVLPESWQTAGGPGTIQTDLSALVVTQPAAVQGQVLAFCQRLRVARGKLPAGGEDPAKYRPMSRLAQMRPNLDRRVTINFPEPAPLARIVADLETISGTKIVVNWLALSAGGISPQVAGSSRVNNQPLRQALDSLLAPLGLGYRAVEGAVLEITTAKAVGSILETEIYPVGALIDKGWAVPSLVERVQSEVAEASWSDAGGPGVLTYDSPSRSLIVLQAQPVHALLEASLARWAETK